MSSAVGTATDVVLALESVTKSYGDVVAVDRVSLDVERGELLAVLGPSGCGKSTLLRSVAGLVRINGGRIRTGGREVVGPRTWMPPERRSVGVVFQDSALFPHLSVAGNVAFGLARRAPDRDARAREMLALVGLEQMAERYPHELSGGEQQRVALARALAPGPSVVLLDEPFSHLDRNLRVHVREETVAVLRAAGATAVLVTHDQEEALAVGDRIAVMRTGRIEQVDVPTTVFHRPMSRFVATFMGEADFVPGSLTTGRARTVLGDLPVLPGTTAGPVEVMVRPHDLEVRPDEHGPATVARTEFRGATMLHELRLDDGAVLRALQPHTAPVPVGTRVAVRVVGDHPLVTFPA
ncbi:MAG TPA: ABC transporter ATP-binding protein [Nocardioidaceae bacterium]|nr:ABC transporter ATP-binding protein [Nocardioidaceae bacterium]